MGQVALPVLLVVFAIGACLAAAALLKAWNGWLELKRLQLSTRRSSGGSAVASARIELADLKERVRRLEAISDGIDL
jgi:hypothetical protein